MEIIYSGDGEEKGCYKLRLSSRELSCAVENIDNNFIIVPTTVLVRDKKIPFYFSVVSRTLFSELDRKYSPNFTLPTYQSEKIHFALRESSARKLEKNGKLTSILGDSKVDIFIKNN
jgi:hypothetical protein